MDNFQGKTAVVTGAASGIGFALARALVREGAQVVLSDRDGEALGAAVAALESDGGDVIGVRADVASRASVQALADAAFARFGSVQLLFNNAGITAFGSIETLTHDDWEWSLSVNLWGVIHGVGAILPHMLAHGEPSCIVNTSSFAGIVPSVHLAPYNVAKAGVVALTETLRKDLRGRNVGASVLCPMRVATRIWESSRAARPEELGGPDAYKRRSVEETAEMVGEILDADDVAQMVLKAIGRNQLFILPHRDSRALVRRRFERMDAAFDAA